jgi:hypothetical protein
MEYSFELGKVIVDDFFINQGCSDCGDLFDANLAYEETNHLFVVTFNARKFQFHGGSKSKRFHNHEALVRKLDLSGQKVLGGGCFFIEGDKLFLTNYSGGYGAVPKKFLEGFDLSLKERFAEYRIQQVVLSPLESKIREFWKKY